MCHRTLGPVARQLQHSCEKLAAQPGLPFAEHLPARQIHAAVRQTGTTFRQRVFNPATTLWTFLSQLFDPDHSCRAAVARLLAWRTLRGLPPCSADNSGYCKARARLPEEALRQLTRDSGRRLHQTADPSWLWHGRTVKVVDGTGATAPDTAENQKAYPKSKKLKPGVGFPVLRLVVVFSLAVGTVLDAAIGRFQGSKMASELALFRSLDDLLDPDDILLGDRLYNDFWDVAQALQRGADVVMRLHAGRTPPWFRGRGHSKGNRRICWRKPPRPKWLSEADYALLPEWLYLRALRVDVRRRGYRTKQLLLVTSLRDANVYPAEDLAELYRQRWQAELNIRSIKSVLQMDVLRTKTPEMVRKEVWGHLLVYNIVRALMVQAARARSLRPEQVSFKGALQTFNAFLPHLHAAHSDAEAGPLWTELLDAIGQHVVGKRPHRYEPRKVKRRPKKFAKMTEPRKQAQQRLAKGEKGSDKKG
jgi:hypothetical protein